jgi:hypothetical protein
MTLLNEVKLIIDICEVIVKQCIAISFYLYLFRAMQQLMNTSYLFIAYFAGLL